MPPIHPLWTVLLVLVCCSGGALAFGAGNIPDFAFLEGKAYRHGDIEDILAEMFIRAASSESSGVFDFVKKVAGMGGEKFSSLNVKRTYFGNWLRDYSQAVDVGTLAKGLDVGTIRILIWILGFMSFGYATAEFEVTEEKLGVYRPEEHIDNPKDYADNEDARRYDQRLRGPVDRRELEVDPRTGIKNYIANEQGGWATSTRYIRESLLKAIELGRRGKDNENDMHEALRLLGQSLHTLEDLGAHSNWVELALIELGYNQVFPHVGTSTQLTPQGSNKRVWPLVTGTFGGTDFIHSLLGEATDKLSQTSLTDLNAAVTDAEMKSANDTFDKIKGLLKMMPSGDANDNLNLMQQQGQTLAGKGKQFHLSGQGGEGAEISPQDIAKEIYPVLEFRDKLMKSITNAIEMVPGLDAAIDEITTSLTVYVLNIVQPYIKPILQVVSNNISKGGHLVMTDENQYLVWNDPHSSDPTHSMLSKDHFSCYLNDPAGQLAQVIVRHAVTQVVHAWSDNSVDPHGAIDSIIQCFCHPALLNRSSQLHMDMFSTVKNWIEGLPSDRKERILEGLTREGVRQGKHHDEEKRKMEQGMPGAHSHGPPQGGNSGHGGQGGQGLKIGGFNVSQGAQILGFQDPAQFFPGSREVQESAYQQQSYQQQSSYEEPRSQGYGRQTETYSERQTESYGQPGYDRAENASFYGQSEEHEEYQKPSHQKKKPHKKHNEEENEGYGQQEYGSRGGGDDSYGQRDTYGSVSRQVDEDTSTYGQRDTYSSRQEDDSYTQRETYSSQRTPAYGQREEQEEISYRETPSYSQREETYGQGGDTYEQDSYNTSSRGEYEDTSVQESFSNLNVGDDEYSSSRNMNYEDSSEYRSY